MIEQMKATVADTLELFDKNELAEAFLFMEDTGISVSCEYDTAKKLVWRVDWGNAKPEIFERFEPDDFECLGVWPTALEAIQEAKAFVFWYLPIDETIKNIGFNQHKILSDILALHCANQPIDADVTYSKGAFYTNGIARPKLCFDLVPRFDYVVKADCRSLPLPDGQLKVVVSDPPFGIGSGPSMAQEKEGQNIIINRFSVFRTGKELFDFYEKMLAEMYRILSVGGILIQKIQPVVACGKQWMTHYHVMAVAKELGFYHKDEFILLAKARLISGKIKKQQHARKYHSYFYVFEKR